MILFLLTKLHENFCVYNICMKENTKTNKKHTIHFLYLRNVDTQFDFKTLQ